MPRMSPLYNETVILFDLNQNECVRLAKCDEHIHVKSVKEAVCECFVMLLGCVCPKWY